jgi:hypothetical protein
MDQDKVTNSDYCTPPSGLDRRSFLRSAAVATAAAGSGLWVPRSEAAPTPTSPAETTVKALYETLTDEQKKKVCFEWDYKDERGLLRTRVSNNWQITKPTIDSDFFTKDQRAIVLDIFKQVFNPEWHERLFRQLKEDTGGKAWGAAQSIALFGTPGSGKFEFVMTGRHMTMRADGDSEAHVALGGPIFHGHAASGFNEKPHHPGNVFWPQAQLANKVYEILDGKQQKLALVDMMPHESAVGFQGDKGKFTGLPTSEMTKDQREAVQKVLMALIEPYRKEDQDEVMECLKKQGGLDKCTLTFYKEGALADNEWDNWRLEGPSFVWHFRGTPHVHIWINVADDPAVPLNAKG